MPRDFSRLLLDDGRHEYQRGQAGTISVDVLGELQIRGDRLSVLPLTAPIGTPSQTTLGQQTYLTEWVRVGAQVAFGDSFRVVAQADLVPYWIVGDLARGVSAARDWATDQSTPSLVRLRYAYAEWTSPVGVFRVGQQGSHWGLGMLTNDGDHPRLFGDYRLGDIVERVLYATHPLGKNSPFVIAFAGDGVLRDPNGEWALGDRAYQAVASVYYEHEGDFAGLYGVRRWEKVAPDASGVGGDMNVWIMDGAARGTTPLGPPDVYGFGGFEAAAIVGTTDAIRTSTDYPNQTIRSFGSMVSLGVVERARDLDGKTFGRIVVELDGGYATGDSNPDDATIHRFSMSGNAAPGLLIFPTVLNAMTARAATNAIDPSLSAHPLPGTAFLASKGGVFGAQYLNPTLVVRPDPYLDLKAGIVVAVATGDLVDPYRPTTAGGARTLTGAPANSHDLGVEIDWGFEWRTPLSPITMLQLGAQGGLFFPGHALDDASGHSLPTQAILQGRVGVQF